MKANAATAKDTWPKAPNTYSCTSEVDSKHQENQGWAETWISFDLYG